MVPGVLRRMPNAESRDPEPETHVVTLVSRAQRGDRDAFALLYRHYVPRVYDYAARRLPDVHTAEEVTQEVFFRAFRGISGCRDGAVFAGWLFGIARFVIADVHRARRHQSTSLEGVPDPEDPAPPLMERMLHAEQRDQLMAARDHCLSSSERELFDLLLADLTDKEIAAALGRRHGAIRTAHWRLVNKLRNCFGIPPKERGR